MLQFRKCEDLTCCQRKTNPLPPKIPAPVLSPDGEKYLKFEMLYGKVVTTEKDCPSLSKTNQNKKEQGPRYKLLASRVTATILCHQCGKTRCVFSLNGSLTPKGQREIEDTIFTCGMGLMGNIYTSMHLVCSTPIENAFYTLRSMNDYICYHCGGNQINVNVKKIKEFRTVYPVCNACKSSGKKEYCANPLPKKKKSISSHGQQAQGSTIESLITGTEGIAEIVKTTTVEGTTREATTTEGTIQEATQNATTTEGTIQEATKEGSTPEATTTEAIPAETALADTARTIKTEMSKIAMTEAEEITGTTASVTATVEGDAT